MFFCNAIPCSPLPVNVGGQEDSCVRRQLGQMNHLGLQLQSVALIHPHVRQSDAYRNTLMSLSGNWQTTAKMTSYENSGVSGGFRTYMSSGVQCSSTFTFPESSFLLAITWKPKESSGELMLWYPALSARERTNRAVEDHTVSVALALNVCCQVETYGSMPDGLHGLCIKEVMRSSWKQVKNLIVRLTDVSY